MPPKFKIQKYATPRGELVSVLRMVPIEHLEDVREQVKEAAEKVGRFNSADLEVRIRFRQSVNKSIYRDNYKAGADAFDVYVDTKNISSRVTKSKRRQIEESNREDVIDALSGFSGLGSL